jgi:hypothetical protein
MQIGHSTRTTTSDVARCPPPLGGDRFGVIVLTKRPARALLDLSPVGSSGAA